MLWNNGTRVPARPAPNLEDAGVPHGMSLSAAAVRRAPRVWAMLGHKAGDNSQVLALAEALGLPFEEKHFVYRPTELATNLLLGPTLAGVVTKKSSPLSPPWPDLIISAGRRNEPICRWIQEQAAPQRVRLVHVGRPWAKIERFDLIVTTPQYRLPNSAERAAQQDAPAPDHHCAVAPRGWRLGAAAGLRCPARTSR